MGKKLPYICIALLALTGLGLAVVPNGMRFTGWLLLGTAAAWAAGMFVVRWGGAPGPGRFANGYSLRDWPWGWRPWRGLKPPSSSGERRTTPPFPWTR